MLDEITNVTPQDVRKLIQARFAAVRSKIDGREPFQPATPYPAGKLEARGYLSCHTRHKRRRIGAEEERLAAHIARKLSSSVKSRLACELLSIVDYDTDARTIGRAFSHLLADELAGKLRNGRMGSAEQMAALWLLHGTQRLSGRILPPSEGRVAKGLLRLLQGVRGPLIFHYIVRTGLSRCRDSLVILYVVFAAAASTEEALHVESHELPPLSMIGDYPAIAYDMHTRIGRQDIGLFASAGGCER